MKVRDKRYDLYNDAEKPLTRNDRAFFALAFYRQTIQEAFRASFIDLPRFDTLADQVHYWWAEFQTRREYPKNDS